MSPNQFVSLPCGKSQGSTPNMQLLFQWGPLRASTQVEEFGRPPFKSDWPITHYVRLKAALSRKLTVYLHCSLALNNRNSSRGGGTINHTQSGTKLKYFTINKRPNVLKIYNKRIHSLVYSILTTNWYMANCMQDTQQINTWPVVLSTYKKLTHDQLCSIHTTNWHMANCVQYSQKFDTWPNVFNTHNKLTYG